MCINEEVSITTLLVGTIVNLYILFNLSPKLNNRNYYIAFIVVLVWQYYLLMQIPDAISWNNIKNNKKEEFPGKLAAFLNLTQPIVTFIGVCFIINKNYYLLIPALTVLIIYIINILVNIKNFRYDIKPEKECTSLNYKWWDLVNPALYLIIFPLLFILLPFKFAITNILIFFGTLFVSMLVNYNCNPGSWWCWSVASAGLINYLII